MRSPRFAAVVQLLRVPAAHEWLLLSALVFFTDRYRWMMDDAFVYFRYIDNLLFLGRGLVYNPGEFVEGFSSPLWLFLLLPFRALGIDYYRLVRLLACVCALGYGVALIWLNRRLCPLVPAASSSVKGDEPAPATRQPIVNFPLAASAAHYGITTHFSSGLETPLVQSIAPLYAAALLAPTNIALQCVVALAPLVRSECGLLAVLYLPYVIVRTRRIPWWFLGCGLIANGGWIVFRLVYYADFLPNTFYLKDSAHWILGYEYWINVFQAHHLRLWIIALIGCAILGREYLRRERGARTIMFVAALLYALYVARIGGDMLYHRYAALPICLGLCGFAGCVEAALVAAFASARVQRVRFSPANHPRLTAASVAILVSLAFGLAYPAQLLSHPFFLPRESRKWRAIADPNWHRRHPELEYTEARSDDDARQREGYRRLRETGEPPKPRIAVEGFCVVAYHKYDAQVIHAYGLTDLVLARLPRPFGRPGHKLVQLEAVDLARQRNAARSNGIDWYDQPRAARWIKRNRDALALLEQKLHNRHDLAENLRLALMRVHLQK